MPDASNAERNDDLSSIVPSETPWQCKPESSTDKMVGDNKNLTARCRWSRTVSVPAVCQISDGCVGSLCWCHAVCRSKATSTVVVLRTTRVSVTAVLELKLKVVDVSVTVHQHTEGRQAGEQAAPFHIQLKVKDLQGSEVQFKIKKSTPLRKLMDAELCMRRCPKASQSRSG